MLIVSPPCGLLQAGSESTARSVVHYRATSAVSQSSPQQLLREEGTNVCVVVKGDVLGSVEVLVGILETRQPQGVAVHVVHSGVGAVVDSDIEMAASTGSEYIPHPSTIIIQSSYNVILICVQV